MSWRDQLRKASFRGVEFFVDGTDSAFGRRTALHEYPLRDKPYVEDLGRKARTVTLEAYVLATPVNGMNYMPGRDALIAALEQAGPGALVHPYLGELRVALQGDAKLRETTAEGGMARFSLTFVEAGEASFPAAQTNTPSIVNQRADAAIVAIEADFVQRFSVEGKPDFVTAAAVELLGGVTKVLKDLPKLIPANVDGLGDFLPDLAAIDNEADSLIRSTDALAGRVTGLLASVRDICNTPDDAMKLLRKLYAFGKAVSGFLAPLTESGTATRSTQGNNQGALLHLVQRAAVVSAARAAAEMDFAAHDDAAAVRTELADQLDAQMAAAESDEVYNRLAALRSATVRDITARGANLARVVSYTPGATLPALVIAYDLYGNAGRDGEIISRNALRHPGFVPGGTPLEVLTNA